MTAPGKTTTTCPVCTHHVQVKDSKVAEHYPEGNLCDGVGLPVLTPGEVARFNDNLTEVAEQIVEFVAVHQTAMESGDRVAALMRTTDVIQDEGFGRDDLTRLLVFAVARLAGGVS